MVLTRRQEAMLKKQYKVGEYAKDEETRASPPVICNGRPEEEDPRTPSTSRSSRSTARRMSNGQHTGLRSALKKYHTERPWEEREIRMMNRLSIIDTDKHVRIGSEKNEVFEFEKDPVSSTDTESDSEDDVKRRLYDEGGVVDEEEEELDGEEEDKGAEMPRIAGGSRPNTGTKRGVHDAMIALAMLILWSLSSSWLTVVMQSVLMHKRMSLPLMVPALSQLGCVIVLRLLHRFGVIKLNPMPPFKEYVRKIVPLALPPRVQSATATAASPRAPSPLASWTLAHVAIPPISSNAASLALGEPLPPIHALAPLSTPSRLRATSAAARCSWDVSDSSGARSDLRSGRIVGACTTCVPACRTFEGVPCSRIATPVAAG